MMTSNDTDYDQNARYKATLFCSDCGYRGQLPEDWLEVCTDSECSLVCPDCGATIDQRTSGHPRPPAEAD